MSLKHLTGPDNTNCFYILKHLKISFYFPNRQILSLCHQRGPAQWGMIFPPRGDTICFIRRARKSNGEKKRRHKHIFYSGQIMSDKNGVSQHIVTQFASPSAIVNPQGGAWPSCPRVVHTIILRNEYLQQFTSRTLRRPTMKVLQCRSYMFPSALYAIVHHYRSAPQFFYIFYTP